MKGNNEDGGGGSLCSSRRVDSFSLFLNVLERAACSLVARDTDLDGPKLLLLGHRHIDYRMPIAIIYLMRADRPNRPPTRC